MPALPPGPCARRHVRPGARPAGTAATRRRRAQIAAATGGDGAAAAGGARPPPSPRLLGPPPSRLERFFAAHEFSTEHTLCCSDVEALTLGDLLALAGPGAAAEGVYGPSLSLGYVPPAGSPGLRSDVAAMLAADAAAAAPGWAAGGGDPSALDTAPFDPAAIFCAAPQELAAMAVTAALEAAGGWARAHAPPPPARPRVVVTAPAYPGLASVAAGLGADLVPWRPRWGEGGPVFEVEDLEAALAATGGDGGRGGGRGDGRGGDGRGDGRGGRRAPPAAAILNFPHSPTGATLSPPAFSAALAACVAAGVGTVLVDELYRLPGAGLPPAVCAARGLLAPPPPPLPRPPPAAAAAAATTTLASLGGLSKWAGLPGLRAGWLAVAGPGGPALLGRVGELRDHGTVCGAAPAEALARLGVRARALLAARAAALLSANADAATRFFGQAGSHGAHFDFYAPPPGAPVCFPALATGEAAAAWAARARAGAGVLLLPGDTFELASGGDARRFRLGLGRAPAKFGAGLSALGAWLDKEPLRV